MPAGSGGGKGPQAVPEGRPRDPAVDSVVVVGGALFILIPGGGRMAVPKADQKADLETPR